MSDMQQEFNGVAGSGHYPGQRPVDAAQSSEQITPSK